MALEEKEKLTYIETILEVDEEEVKVTPPARRKKAERMKNKSSGNLPSQACSDATNGASLGEKSDTLSEAIEKTNEHGFKTRTPELYSHLGTMSNVETHEQRNGMSENSWNESNERPVGNNNPENSIVRANETVALASQLNSTATSKENEEVAETLTILNDKKGDLSARLETCISPDITSGCTSSSQDEESFFSAEEAETTALEVISAPLPKLSEVLTEKCVELHSNEIVSLLDGEEGNTKQKTAVCSLEGDAEDPSKTSNFNTSECADESLEILASANKEESDEIVHTSSKISDKHSLSAETRLTDINIANRDVAATVGIVPQTSTSEGTAAVGNALEADSDSEEEWSSSSDSSSTEGEYDVDYFEVHLGIQGSSSQDSSKDGLNEILLAFPSGTELVSVTTDSEDDSNRGDTPRNFFKNVEESSINGDDSDSGMKMLACFSPAGECPVVVDDTTSEKEKVTVNTVQQSESASESEDAAVLDPSINEGHTHDNSDRSHNNKSGLLDSTDGISVESPNVDYPPSNQENSTLEKKRSGSFRLIKSNGSLKIVSELTMTKEDVREARLQTQCVKGESSRSSYGQSAADSTVANAVLESTVSEAKTINDDFSTVFADIASLEKLNNDDVKSADAELDAKGGDVDDGIVDSSPVLISTGSPAFAEQKVPVPLLNLKGVTMDESATEREECATEGKANERTDDADFSSSNKKKQRPRVLLGKRYSLHTETNLLSPEDDTVELRNFGDSGSFKNRPSPCISTEAQASSAEATAVDGQEEINATPVPPQRAVPGRLTYSESFTPGFTRSVIHRPKENYGRPLSKRPRSERRSKTLPNNVFDVFGAFKSSSPPPENVGPITLITDNLPANFPGFPIDRRAQVALELYTTERSYVRALETILQLFKRPCEENKLLEKKEITTMFLNVHDIFFVNKDLLFMLLERINHWHDHQCIGDIFLDQSFKIIERMKTYAKYCNNYDSAETLYKQKIKKSKDFEAFVNSCYEHSVCQPGLNLPAYLIKVVQRIPRYLLLLENLLKRTPESHPDHGNLTKALAKMDNLAVYINNQLQTVVGLRAFEELRSRVMGLKAFEVPGRALIKEADVVVNGNKKTYKCLLFNDILVFGLRGLTKSNEFQKLELTTLWCMDLEDNNPQSGKDDSLEIYTPESSYIMYAGTKNEKKVWLQKLRTTIAMALHGVEATEKDEIGKKKCTVLAEV